MVLLVHDLPVVLQRLHCATSVARGFPEKSLSLRQVSQTAQKENVVGCVTG